MCEIINYILLTHKFIILIDSKLGKCISNKLIECVHNYVNTYVNTLMYVPTYVYPQYIDINLIFT